MSKCSSLVLSSEDGAVVFRQSPRYQLQDGAAGGDVSLTVVNAEWSDAGVYGCRVEIPGLFNDHKVNIRLDIEEAPVEQPITEHWTLTTDTTQGYFDVSTFTLIGTEATEEDFKAFLGVENLGRVAAIFLLTVIIILVFIFRQGFVPGRQLQHLNTPAAENIYESI